jgi:putative two-component system response regulator
MLSQGRIEEHIAAYQKITEGPYIDNLTGLFNYGFFQSLLEDELLLAQQHGTPLVVGICDLDTCDPFHVQYSGAESDRTLRRVAGLLKDAVGDQGFAARFPGGQIALVLALPDIDQTFRIVERFREEVYRTMEGKLTVSIGLAKTTDGGRASRNLLLTQAYEALKKAKRQGENRVCRYSPDDRERKAGGAGRIMIVDDEPLNLKLLEGLLKPTGLETVRASNGEEVFRLLREQETDLVLLDVMMPCMDGFEVCRRLKTQEETRLIPVILITALNDSDSRVKGIEAGADDFLTKPPCRMELLARIRSLIRMKRLNSSLIDIESVLFLIANAVEAKDHYTQGHVERVSKMAIALGKRLGLGCDDLSALKMGGALHDIGKLAVPETVLNKPGPLTPRERKLMESHPEIGYHICLPLRKNLGAALEIIRHHHEKLDGSGYPDGLRGEEIPLAARIMAVADMYDALASDRPYRQAMDREEALKVLRLEGSQGKLDRTVVACLLAMVAEEAEVENGEEPVFMLP